MTPYKREPNPEVRASPHPLSAILWPVQRTPLRTGATR